MDKKKVIDYFIQLLPITMQDRFSGVKNYLNELHLESALNNQIHFLTEMCKQETIIANNVMTFKGSFIKSSDIVREFEKYAIYKVVNVNALHSVYFDISLNLHNIIELTIISPKWFV